MFKKIVSVILTTVLSLTLCLGLAGCNKKGVVFDTPVELSDVNSSAGNVARAYLESIFNNNSEAFYKCYPGTVYDSMKVANAFEQYQAIVQRDIDGEFIGTAYVTQRPYNADNGYDYDTMLQNIALYHELSLDGIKDIQVVEVKVYMNYDNKNMSTELYMCVYKTADGWFCYEMQNAPDDSNS